MPPRCLFAQPMRNADKRLLMASSLCVIVNIGPNAVRKRRAKCRVASFAGVGHRVLAGPAVELRNVEREEFT
jgi:hypothetical protein